MSTQKLPQGGGSFARQSDGSLKQVEKPTTDPIHKPVTPATSPSKSGSKKETK